MLKPLGIILVIMAALSPAGPVMAQSDYGRSSREYNPYGTGQPDSSSDPYRAPSWQQEDYSTPGRGLLTEPDPPSYRRPRAGDSLLQGDQVPRRDSRGRSPLNPN